MKTNKSYNFVEDDVMAEKSLRNVKYVKLEDVLNFINDIRETNNSDSFDKGFDCALRTIENKLKSLSQKDVKNG